MSMSPPRRLVAPECDAQRLHDSLLQGVVRGGPRSALACPRTPRTRFVLSLVVYCCCTHASSSMRPSSANSRRRSSLGMKSSAMVILTSAAALSATSVVSPARGARSELLELLRPSAELAPLPITGRVAELVDELEQAAMVPATPSFLAFGLNGRWQLRALLGPEDLEPATGPPLHSLAPAAAPNKLPQQHAAS